MTAKTQKRMTSLQGVVVVLPVGSPAIGDIVVDACGVDVGVKTSGVVAGAGVVVISGVVVTTGSGVGDVGTADS